MFNLIFFSFISHFFRRSSYKNKVKKKKKNAQKSNTAFNFTGFLGGFFFLDLNNKAPIQRK